MSPRGRGSLQGERRRREARGRAAETAATLWLRLRGYRVLRRRLKTPLGEIDIVAARGDVVAIVEVKARRNSADGLGAIAPRQRLRIERATAWFLAQSPMLASRNSIRFDVIVVRPRRLPIHVENAWTPERGGT